MINEAIILAGGLGRRLQSIVKDVPKPMADINGKPFLEYLLNYLYNQEIRKVILSVGYKYEVIQGYFKNEYKSLQIEYSVENHPLGTGGGVKKALNLISENDFLILNGDTFFSIEMESLYEFYRSKKPDLAIALKYIKNPGRYGLIKIDIEYRIINYFEKNQVDNKRHNLYYINGGIYITNMTLFQKISLPNKFSFEKEFLGEFHQDFQFYGFPLNSYFIDIGTPSDYKKVKSGDFLGKIKG